MTNSYLIEIIKAITPVQREKIEAFLSSSLFYQGSSAQELSKFYSVILTAAPDFREEHLDKNWVYDQVFPNVPHVQGKLEKLMVELNKQIRLFLLIERYLNENNEPFHQIEWMAWLRESGLVSRAQSLFPKLKKDKDHSKESLKKYHIEQKWAEEAHELQSISNRVKGDLGIPELIQSLDAYYQNYRLELENRYLLQQKGLPLPGLETLQNDKQYYQDNSLLYFLSNRINLLLRKDTPDMEAFQEFFILLKSNEDRLSFDVQAQFYAYLRSLCTLLINSGYIDFAKLLHSIHQDNLDRGLFFVNNEISPNSYIGIVQIAIRVKEINWGVQVTEKFKGRIIGGDNDSFFYKFNLSHCLFHLGRLDDALSNLPEFSSQSHYHGIIRRLELKIYYEMQSELLSYKMFAFRKYYERTAAKSISANLRTMQIEFFNILLQITQSPPKDKARSQRLIERIQKKKLLADRAWLLEKARELG